MDRKPPPPYADMPLPDLLRQLSSDTATLVRQEIALARVELTDKGKKAVAPAAMFAMAAVALLGAFGAFTAFFIALLALVVQLWAAALIVAVVYGIVAAFAALNGKKKLDTLGSPVPDGSVQSVKDDIDAVRAGVRRAR